MNGNLARDVGRGVPCGMETEMLQQRGRGGLFLFIVRDRLHGRLPSSTVKYDHSKNSIFVIGRKDVRRSPPLPSWMGFLVVVLVFAVLWQHNHDKVAV